MRAVLLLALVVIASAGCRARARGNETIDCVPGQGYFVGCSCGIGSCDGDTLLHACDGTLSVDACTLDTSIMSSDDTCGSLCPSLVVECPPSGALTIVTEPFPGRTGVCRWESEPSGFPPGV